MNQAEATTGATYSWQGALIALKATEGDTGGAFGLVEATFPEGFGPPLHVHRREDESFYVLEGRIRFRRGDEERWAGPGELVLGPRGVPHTFKVGEGGARALVLVTPGGFEQMFVDGGQPAQNGVEPPQEYDTTALEPLTAKYGFDIVGPPLS